jgi:two-component system sensor histidine kinase BaeS
MRLGLKLTLAFLIVGLIGVAFVALFASRATESVFGSFIFDQYRESLIDQFADYYLTHESWVGVEETFPFPVGNPFARMRPFDRPGGAIALMNDHGIVIISGHGYKHGEQVSPGTLDNAIPVEVDEKVVGWLIATPEGFGRNPAEALFLNNINRMLVSGAIGALVVSLLLGIFLARTLTRPIREITTATRAVADGDLEQRVPVRSHDELGELATSFNLMSAELARSINLRRQMTADIAHELRTPISVILGHVDAMDDGVLPASSDTFYIIRDEATRLERMVDDLRTLSRADAGELILTCRLTQMQDLLDQAIRAYRPHARKKDIKLRLEISPDIPEVNIDPDRMAQVMGNLLSNALRYTPQGGDITLSTKHTVGEIEIRVQDSGPGIGPEELPNVFDRFYRTDKSRQRESGGSGLGLAIAKSIVEGHGGRIWAESEGGEGTTIVIALPVPSEKPLSA